VIRLRRRSATERTYARSRRRDPATPWREERYAVLDFEATGLDPRVDEIVSFASVPIDDSRVVPGKASAALVRPKRMPNAETIRIHGLRPVDLEGAPDLPGVIDLILRSLTGRSLVAHVAWVERGFLEAMLRPIGLRPPEPIIDTAALAARALAPGGAADEYRPRLADVARALGLPVHSPHTATGDALTTAQVFLALATRLDRSSPQTVGSLAGVERGRARFRPKLRAT
jgi:DNA polymerase-3 subunit epsilon